MSLLVGPRLSLLGAGGLSGAQRAVRYGLVSAWNMEEASGNRADNFGPNGPMTDVNTVTSGTAKVGALAAQFTAANSERLTLVDNASISPVNTPWWWSAWVNHDSLPASGFMMGIVDKLVAGAGQRSYKLFVDNTAGTIRYSLRVRGSDDVADHNAFANAFGTPTTGGWNHLFAWHDPDADVIGIMVNAGSPNTTAHSQGTLDGTAGLLFGASSSSGTNSFFDGRIDAIAFGNNVPGGFGTAPAAEIAAYLYNGGAGREWPWAA